MNEKNKQDKLTREEALAEAKQEFEVWQEVVKKFPSEILTRVLEKVKDKDEAKDNPVYMLMARELLRRKIMNNINKVMTSKVLRGTASREEYEAWQLHEQYGVPYDGIVNLDEVMDEDMAYWYERGCPPDDCPGFRGD